MRSKIIGKLFDFGAWIAFGYLLGSLVHYLAGR